MFRGVRSQIPTVDADTRTPDWTYFRALVGASLRTPHVRYATGEEPLLRMARLVQHVSPERTTEPW